MKNINAQLIVRDDGWLYIGDETYRYALGKPGKKNILVIGINPSTATPEKPDATISRVMKVPGRLGNCDGWIMINLCPIRARNIEELPLSKDASVQESNLNIISMVAQQYNIEKIWAAWGNLINRRVYFPNCLLGIYSILGSERWCNKGELTLSGNPRHPLYLNSDSSFIPFSIEKYCSKFRED